MFAEHTYVMGDQCAVLSPVQEGDIWRVQIIWPDGKRDYVGEFSSEGDATKWMHRHAWWLIEPENPTSKQSKPSSAA